MLRSIIAAIILFGPVAQAAIWPDQFAGFTRKSTRAVEVAAPAVWEEYGLEEAETAVYVSGAAAFDATAWRLRDSTGGMAAFQWQRPAEASASELGTLTAETPPSTWVAFGNYLFRFDGRKPTLPELAQLIHRLPRLEQSSLPVLPDYVPARDRVANSERYVLGPASLEKFEPRIPPSVAAFHYGTEAQLATYRTTSGDVRIAVFSYPTPHIARERLEAFRGLAGAVVKRSGPLVAVTLSPPSADAAELVLSRVTYAASLTWNEYRASRRDNIADLILTIFSLTGILLLFALLSGLAVGGLRIVSRRLSGGGQSQDPMIMLHLEDKQRST